MQLNVILSDRLDVSDEMLAAIASQMEPGWERYYIGNGPFHVSYCPPLSKEPQEKETWNVEAYIGRTPLTRSPESECVDTSVIIDALFPKEAAIRRCALLNGIVHLYAKSDKVIVSAHKWDEQERRRRVTWDVEEFYRQDEDE